MKKNKISFGIINQFQNSATSIGAMIREAAYAQSKADFINKMSIALKEANETDYWFSLLLSKKIINSEKDIRVYKEFREILYLLISSINTAKRNLKNQKNK